MSHERDDKSSQHITILNFSFHSHLPNRFHERCIESWKNGYYLMHGDTFFVFCCKICNDGEEFIRRLDLNFKTALHLVLYDFAMTRAQKSYSVSKEIAPFLIDNWNKLNIPFEVSCE